MTATSDHQSAISWREDLQYRIEYALFRGIVALVRALPLDTGASISAAVWKRVAPLTRRHKRALENLARAYPDKTPAEHRRIAVAMWGNLGRTMAEGMQLDRIVAEPDRLTFENAELLERYRGRLGSAIGVTIHTGNWELATWPLSSAGGQPAAIYRLIKNPYVDRYIRRARAPLFPGGLLAKGKAHGSNAEGQRTARIIMDYVRNGGRLGIVCDLYDRSGIPVPFFGHDAKSTPVPAMIARRTGARIWMARCVRVGTSSRFRFDVRELKVPRTDNMGEDIRSCTAAMHAQFEEWVREHPEQWMWSNRRWS